MILPEFLRLQINTTIGEVTQWLLGRKRGRLKKLYQIT
jgi:hypothetical protein